MNNMMEREMKQAELRKVDAEIAKLIAESAKINQEAAKMREESRWYPFIVATGILTAATGFVALISKLF